MEKNNRFESKENVEICPTMIEGHATTFHDGSVAILFKDGHIEALAAERVDKYKHSYNSEIAYRYLTSLHTDDDMFDPDSKYNNFTHTGEGIESSGHHLYHAASTFFGSGFDKSAILVIDGQGPHDAKVASTTIWMGSGENINLIEAPYLSNTGFSDRSIGHFYTAIGALAGMKELYSEGKTMGLAAFGSSSKYIDFFRKYAHANDDGSYFIDPNFIIGVFGNTLGKDIYGWGKIGRSAQRVFDEFITLRGCPLRDVGEDVSKDDMDIAYAGQQILEEIVLALVKRVKNLTNSNNLCLAGGVMLNSVLNKKILSSGIFKNIYIFPASGDDGQAIGKLFARIHAEGIDANTEVKTAYFGPEYSEEQIIRAIEINSDNVEVISSTRESTLDIATDFIIQGKVIGWFQGRSEIGPRALGHRSILADPRDASMREFLNKKVKHREWYRPFAPVILEEELDAFFDLSVPSPFMLYVADVNLDKVGIIPSACHIDNTARVQTINEEQDEMYYEIVKLFGKKTGVPVLLNTSFNDSGEPIVESPSDAIKSFLKMKIDALVINDRLMIKK